MRHYLVVKYFTVADSVLWIMMLTGSAGRKAHYGMSFVVIVVLIDLALIIVLNRYMSKERKEKKGEGIAK